MKILEKGRPQKGWAEKFSCTGAGNGNGGCGAVLLVEQDDVYQTSSSARDETSWYNTFKCEGCGVETDIPSNIRLPFDRPSKAAWEKRRKARGLLVDGPS